MNLIDDARNRLDPCKVVPELCKEVKDEIGKIYDQIEKQGKSVRDTLNEIADKENVLNPFLANAVLNKKVDNLLSPHIDPIFHGFSDDLRKILPKIENNDQIAQIHELGELSGQIYAEKEGAEGNYGDCVVFVKNAVAGSAVYFGTGSAAANTATGDIPGALASAALAEYIKEQAPEIAGAVCHRIYPDKQ